MSQLSLWSVTRERQYYDCDVLVQRISTQPDGGALWIHYYWDAYLAGGGDDVEGALFSVDFDYSTGLYRFTDHGRDCYRDAAGFGQWHIAVTTYSRNAPSASALVEFGERQLTYEPRRYRE